MVTTSTPGVRRSERASKAIVLRVKNHASDTLFESVRAHFTDKELADLTTLVGLINAWNRLTISLRYKHS